MSTQIAAVIITGMITFSAVLLTAIKMFFAARRENGNPFAGQITELKTELKERDQQFNKRFDAIESKFERLTERLTGMLFTVLKDHPSDAQQL